MANTITHAFVSVLGDGPDATEVRPSNWNANHVIAVDTTKAMTSTPGSPAESDVWWEVTGTSPTEVWTQKGRRSGVTRVLQTITF